MTVFITSLHYKITTEQNYIFVKKKKEAHPFNLTLPLLNSVQFELFFAKIIAVGS